MRKKLTLSEEQFRFIDQLTNEVFEGDMLPEGTVLTGVGIQSRRSIDPSGESTWYHLDLWNRQLHDGRTVRLWGAFPVLSEKEDALSFHTMVQSSGLAEMFLTATPETARFETMEYVAD